ncbi:hypothetical protein [Eubacterium sp. 14-2]|nr:hypothetical protein [Eubacterium sp. 14-2]
MNKVKVSVKADSGKRSQVIEYGTGTRVEIPINSDGTVKWYKDKRKTSSH